MYQKIKDIIKDIMIPKRALFYMALCLSGIIIIILIGIIPNWISLIKLDRKATDLKIQLEEQKQIYPIYSMLKNNDHQNYQMALPFPVKNKLLRESIGLFPVTLESIAKEAGMDTISISPDINLLSSGSKFLFVNAVLRGDFLSFRRLLIGLGKIPYSESVEEIQIEQKKDAMEFILKIRIALA
ncbi:MAG: hypothetical protein KKC46_07480 [Proteobacteria bacterium]|nr:hypothetical protein [Pseudomonadota bacterium]